jgi:putative transposase
MNAADIDIEFSEITSSKVQSYGIDLNTFVYRSPQLLLLRRVLPANTVVHVKWPRNDVGYIWVWDSVGDQYIKVRNTEPEYAGLTLDQAKAARKAKSDGDPSYVQTQAEAGAIIRGMVAEADRSTKLAQRRQGGRLAHRTSRKAREGDPATEVQEGLPDAGEPLEQVADMPLEDFAIELPLAGEEV